VLPPGIPHAYGAHPDTPWTIPWLHIAGRLVGDFLRELGATPGLPVVRVGLDPRALGLFEEILDTLEHGYLPTQLFYAAQSTAHLLGRWVQLRHTAAREARDPADAVRRSIEFMKLHLDRPLRVSSLAAVAGLSASHFNTLFRSATGYPPVDYHIRLRMHRACQLLDTTQLPVKEIAARLGYEDPLYFSRAFRSVIERAPSEYRRDRKG
jgi:AraC-like DNA-binding protein